MSWYKKANKQLWEIDPTSKEYNDIDIDTLDRLAFGFSEKDITRLSPRQLKIKWQDDLNNVIQEQQYSGKSKEEWARNIDLNEPIEVIFEDGVFKIDDGHHRYYATLILGIELNVSLTIKDKPHLFSVVKALSEGKPVPPEIIKFYNL